MDKYNKKIMIEIRIYFVSEINLHMICTLRDLELIH
jgi:hypothetical protein